MTRPIEYDPDAVLESAMLQFWEKGYQATSMRDLTTRTGLNPGSIYLAFRTKQGLFVAVLERYFNQRLKNIRTVFGTDEPALVRLNNYLDMLIESSQTKVNNCSGCLLVNTMLEIPDKNTEIKRFIIKAFQEVEHEIKKVLDDAQANGEISKDKDTKGLAKLIITTHHGIRVLNKTHPDRATLESIIINLMSIIKE